MEMRDEFLVCCSFSQVLVDQVSRSRNVALDRIMTQRRRVSGAPGVVLLLQKDPPSVLGLQAPHVKQRWRRRQSVWERLGWQQVSRLSFPRPQGFWSFINKYRWRTRITSTLMRRGRLRSRLGQHHIPTKTNVQKLTAGPRQRPQLNLQMGRAAATWRRSKDNVPTKRQLDAELDEYMSLSKTRLDKELDEYMSLSRSRLDAQLDEYMSMAGQMPPQWD
ncbi:uncharacterized protein LOC115044608 [Echeneis naucrates]|uniref:uncharacterized protein LOC115044608 n=1 Tax=Echeneis naucrates TaxID=173247 RepID=UPI00111356F2|nr:uncharacterized protein LOC115044608 [Echeneis naucrates]